MKYFQMFYRGLIPYNALTSILFYKITENNSLDKKVFVWYYCTEKL